MIFLNDYYLQPPMKTTIVPHSRVAVLRKLPPFSSSAATLATQLLDWGASDASTSGDAPPAITQEQRDLLVVELLKRCDT